MQAFGAPQADIDRVAEQIARAAKPQAGDRFPVHADNERTVAAFLALRTQWQYAGLAGQRTGLNYASVLSWLRERIRIPRQRRQVLAGIETMEKAVLAYDAEQRQKEGE